MLNSDMKTIEDIEYEQTESGFETLIPGDLRWLLGSQGLDTYHETHEDELR